MPKIIGKRHRLRLVAQAQATSMALIEAAAHPANFDHAIECGNENSCNSNIYFDDNCDHKPDNNSDNDFDNIDPNDDCSDNSANNSATEGHTSNYNSTSTDLVHSDNVSVGSDASNLSNVSNESEVLIARDSSNYTTDNDDAGEEIDFNVNLTLDKKLALWAVEDNVPHSKLRKLLNILRNEQDLNAFSQLPKDPRTLLSTPNTIIQSRILDPGSFYYSGISSTINNLFEQNDFNIPRETKFELSVNIDGLPLSTSSSSSLWPILFQIKSIPRLKDYVFMAGIYHGYEKPKDPNDFLSEFIEESVNLIDNGILIQEQLYAFRIAMLVCDTPAKSYILAVKGHSGYFSCCKCKQEGDMVNNVMCFPETVIVRRTDNEFRQQLQEEHHTGYTIFNRLPEFDMIQDVCLDRLHLVDLGVSKRMVAGKKHGWVFGKQPHKLPSHSIKVVSDHLLSIRKFIPCEFGSRKTRALNDCRRFKATEWRLLLLYTGIVVFKAVLDPNYYYNLVTLHVAVRIMSSDKLCQQPDLLKYANDLMLCFVQSSSKIYGYDFISCNVHNLLHLKDDVSRFGNIENFSAYKFENYMQRVKKMVRKGGKPLQQIVKRVSEGAPTQPIRKREFNMVCSQEHHNGPLIQNCTSSQYKSMKTDKFTVKLTAADCYVKLLTDEIVYVKNIASHNGEIVIIGQVLTKKKDFFTKPCPSSLIGIYAVSSNEMQPLHSWNVKEIEEKLVFLPLNDNQAVVFPFLHM